MVKHIQIFYNNKRLGASEQRFTVGKLCPFPIGYVQKIILSDTGSTVTIIGERNRIMVINLNNNNILGYIFNDGNGGC